MVARESTSDSDIRKANLETDLSILDVEQPRFSTGWSDTGDYQENFINYAGKLNVTPGYHILTHGSPAFNEKSLFSWLRKL